MKTITTKILTSFTALLLSVPCMYAQNIFDVYNNGHKYKVSLPAEKNWTMVKKGSVYTVEPKTLNDTRADEGGFNISIKQTCNDDGQPSKVVMFNKENTYFEYYYDPKSDVTLKNVQPGTYDVFMEFTSPYTFHYVFREDVEISGDCELEFNMAEATNNVTYKFYDQDGDELFIDEYNDSGKLQRSGTADNMVKCTNIVNKDFGRTEAFILSFGAMRTGHLEEFFINDVSSDYCVIQGTQIGAYDEYYNYGSIITDVKTQTIETNPSDLKLVTTKFYPTAFQSEDPVAHTPAVELQTLYRGRSMVTITMGSEQPAKDNIVEMYIDAPYSVCGPDHEFTATAQPMCSDGYEIEDYYGEEEYKYYYMKGRLVSNTDKGIMFTAGGFDSDSYGFNRVDKGLNLQFFPGLPELSYEQENTSCEYGNYSPTLSFKTIRYEYDNEMVEMFIPKYVGRYSDLNEIGTRFIEPTEKQVDGGREITIVNNYPTVDGVPAGNEALMFVTNVGDDQTAPTVQLLTFKDKDNNSTDRLETNEGARMIVMGGDFVFERNEDHIYKPGYFTCQDAELNISYSKSGENNWQDINVVVYPEKKHMPAFGNHYEADLTNADVEKGWYDVKLLMTDAAGNYQSQIVKRAFHIENSFNSIDEINSEKRNVIFTGNEIVAFGAERITLSSISGSLVAETNAERMKLENLTDGVYIAVAYMNDGSKISQKVIIR